MKRGHRPRAFGGGSVVALALGSAVLYAVASVAQTHEASRAPERQSLRPRLLLTLVRRPVWLLGNACDLGGYGLQFLALREGSLALVQPLLLSGLLFAMPLGAVVGSGRLRRRDWLGAAAVVAGLAAFLLFARPGPARPTATPASWVSLGVACVITVSVLVAVAARSSRRRRAALLSAASGVVFGLTAALTETTGDALRHGVLHVVASWPLYALVAAGAVGMVLVQSSFQEGVPGASLPLMTVLDPLVSIGIGAFVFGEQLALRGPALAAGLVALAVMTGGVLLLGTSPVVLGPRVQ